jgi:hypothetical protein
MRGISGSLGAPTGNNPERLRTDCGGWLLLVALWLGGRPVGLGVVGANHTPRAVAPVDGVALGSGRGVNPVCPGSTGSETFETSSSASVSVSEGRVGGRVGESSSAAVGLVETDAGIRGSDDTVASAGACSGSVIYGARTGSRGTNAGGAMVADRVTTVEVPINPLSKSPSTKAFEEPIVIASGDRPAVCSTRGATGCGASRNTGRGRTLCSSVGGAAKLEERPGTEGDCLLGPASGPCEGGSGKSAS